MGIDTSLAPALTKALQAARLMLPQSGGILISVSDREKAEVVPIARRLAGHGYEVYATEGTATILRAVGIEVAGVPAKVSEGEEGAGTTTDLIRDGHVHAVVNTMSGNRVPRRDGFEIRRAATEQGIPCYTSLDTFRVAVDSVTGGAEAGEYSIMRLDEYVNGRPSDEFQAR